MHKPIILTYHAEVERMAWFGIKLEWVERAVHGPDWMELDPVPGIERRFKLIPEFKGRVLRVACVEEEDHIRVLSVFPDRNARRRRAPRHDL